MEKSNRGSREILREGGKMQEREKARADRVPANRALWRSEKYIKFPMGKDEWQGKAASIKETYGHKKQGDRPRKKRRNENEGRGAGGPREGRKIPERRSRGKKKKMIKKKKLQLLRKAPRKTDKK